MKKHFLIVCCLAGLALASSSCKKVYDDKSLAPLDQAYAPIPVTVTNADFFERFYIVVAKAPTATEQGKFTINFSIPADKGKIKEITRVAVGGSGLANVQTGAPALLYNYNGTSGSTPIPGNGSNTITFSSSLTDYKTFQTRVGTGVAPTSATVSTNPQSPNQIDFYFLITLEDGTTIIPPRVQVRVV
ncbi:hypothetical protein AUC43_07300 [Hymenobacter sedentarius]|uniref:DUF1735 domain-containing protein n=1 Tax=Hymenobacter sedentarius TaxID=1411621 RepID=A0A0U4BXE7_9BACT|nr:hypothetical protein [Hymenobacter sedentarius]ALW84913.1 hypothetical protein AUC43_07300 [Hymenobacter sedentarius]